MKQNLLIVFAFLLLACAACRKDRTATKSVVNISQLTAMRMQTNPNNSSTYHFFYDSSNYVCMITEIDSILNMINLDTLSYQYTPDHSLLLQAEGLIGYESHEVVTYGFYSDYNMLEGVFYPALGAMEVETYRTYYSTDKIPKYLYHIHISGEGEQDDYQYDTVTGNIVSDTLYNLNIISERPSNVLSVGSNRVYDNRHNYAALLRGLVNPTIHNLFFPFYCANNCTSITYTDYTKNPAVTYTVTTSYEYNEQGYPTKSVNINPANGLTTTTWFTYK